MQDMSALADSAQAPLDMMSLVADQHASIAVNCGVHGRIAAATERRKRRELSRKHARSEGMLTLTRPDLQPLDVHLVFSPSNLSMATIQGQGIGRAG